MTPAIETELEAWHRAGMKPRFWLRDDDAIQPTPALDRLLDLIERTQAPLLLAVIPAGATPALASRLARANLVTPCQHGFSHKNHAPAGEKACELGGARAVESVLSDITTGRNLLCDVFGGPPAPILVPPWNRISTEVAAHLPGLGLSALSTFGAPRFENLKLYEVNCHLDVIEWKRGRTGLSPARLQEKLLAALISARNDGGRPIGILSHHLVHDEAAWTSLESVLSFAPTLDKTPFLCIKTLFS